MAQSMLCFVVWIVPLLFFMAMAEATPPGIANHPSRARCNIPKYKHCYNLEHVCPKFCPSGCTVECASCKPICIDGPTPTDPPDPEAGGAGQSRTYPPPPTATYPPPSPPPLLPPSPPNIPSTLPTPTTSPPPSPPHPTPNAPTTPHDPPLSSPPPTPTAPSTPQEPPSSSPPPTPTAPTTPHEPPSSSPPPTPTTPSPSPPTSPGKPPSLSSPPLAPSSPSPATPTIPSPSPPHPTPSPPTTPSNPPLPPYSPTPTPPTPSSPSSPPSHTPSNRPPTTPPSIPSSPKKAKCKNRNYPQCYNTEHMCPSSCSGGCEVDCVACKPVCKCDMPGAVCQDPRFIGGDGITFYFHGKKDSDFCLVSDANLHINGHFIGRQNQNMKRDFTWVQSIGILFDNHKLFIGAQKAATWDDHVDHLALAFDGEPLVLEEAEGAKWKSKAVPGSVSITRVDATNAVIVEAKGNFKITAKVVPITQEDSRVHNYGITSDDCFAHLDLAFKFFSLSDKVNGVLGQTYRSNYMSPVKMSVAMPVMGGDKEFAASSLFATDCAVASFLGSHNSSGEASTEALESRSLSCGSGVDGHGIVCKR